MIDAINKEYYALWEKHADEEAGVPAYAPMQYRLPKVGSLVFVGINPSFSVTGWRKHRNRLPDNFDAPTFYRWPDPVAFDADQSHKVEDVMRKHYPFFAPHRELGKYFGVEWDHFDLFAYREKSQNEARKHLLVEKRGKIDLTPFAAPQFELFLKLLALAQPKVVIVLNALASRIYATKRTDTLRFDRATGAYRDQLEDGNAFPVIFSGMVTGGRALDRFSRDRLYRQIGDVLGKEWIPTALDDVHAYQQTDNEK